MLMYKHKSGISKVNKWFVWQLFWQWFNNSKWCKV